MFIVWGKKEQHSAKGYAAYFCPFCRDLRGFRVKEIRTVSHLYYVPLGKGEVIGYRLDCLECGVPQYFEHAPITAFRAEPGSSVDVLAAETNPTLREDFKERLILEGDIRAGRCPSDPDTRMGLLLEPFQVMGPQMEEGCANTRVDLGGTLGCLGTVVALVITFFVARFLVYKFIGAASAEEYIVYSLLAVGLVGGAITLWQFHRAARRWLEKKMVPHLLRALQPLKPTREEIELILAVYKDEGQKFAGKLRSAAFFSKESTAVQSGVIENIPIE